MPAKKNPLKLNALQLKTLCLFQALTEDVNHAGGEAEQGGREILFMPQPHGDHFHVADGVVLSRDATGLANPAVWKALGKKGLIAARPGGGVIVTAEGMGYDTGVRKQILHGSDH